MAMESSGPAQSGIIDQERFCIGCGYNLRTLHWQAKCPECGRAVLDALGQTLQSADVDWLRSLFLGMVLLEIHPVLALAAALATGHLRPREWSVAAYLIAPVGPRIMILAGLAGRS